MASYFGSILIPLSIGLLASCSNSRKTVYFNEQKDASIASTITVPQSIIRNNDLLSINVSSLNPEATAIFNTPNTTVTPTSGVATTGAAVQTTGYLVKADGNIQFPLLGNVKAAGLNSNQLAEQLTRTLTSKKLLVDPIVTVRFLNYRVTVLGEVSRPTVINVPDEKISLLEALGLAGDITIFGKKDNVMVIREEEGQKIIKRINLNSSELFQSPYYYLKSNDIVYVEPNNARVASSTRTNQLLPILLSGLSFAAIIVDRVTR
ncbi:polysaccharide biosynthesis/export family protein [Aridibaculum aurantiacum]|uniref:polysaccharide biosynthesis/export family protein n=1 Tax=Aridibaculum aurantiacum TaxID=2810307 RepID=UPI001A961B61|nr:polysaccharide biosynthesis/export family protein [Aridibaculum aurantiacum]